MTPLSLDDVDGLLLAANEDRSMYGFTRVPDTRSEMTSAVEALLIERDRLVGVPFATRQRESGDIVGMTRFLTLRWWFERDYPDAARNVPPISAASAQRTVINTEAKLMMLAHAFDVWGVQRLDLKTDARNDRSRRAIERLGASFDGVLRNWQPSMAEDEGGLVRNSAMYSVVPDQWPTIREQLQRRLT